MVLKCWTRNLRVDIEFLHRDGEKKCQNIAARDRPNLNMCVFIFVFGFCRNSGLEIVLKNQPEDVISYHESTFS